MGESRFTATLTGERQITLPRGLCERLGLHRGDTVTLVEDEAGVHIEKTDNSSGDGVPAGEGFGAELKYWQERIRPRLKELGWEGMTSDEVFEEIRGRKINTLPEEGFASETDEP